ncbi:MAG: hypothetical protein K1X75_15700 [Leptospirales bacterium]|nr:hypothetical protein [Leptospirales bacterium]
MNNASNQSNESGAKGKARGAFSVWRRQVLQKLGNAVQGLRLKTGPWRDRLRPLLERRPLRVGIIAAGGTLLAGILLLVFFYARSAFGEVYRPDARNAPPSPQFGANELGIVQATPAGAISVGDLKKEVVVVFSDPMVPLAALENEAQPCFEMTPRPAGKFRWYGSRVCAFVPTEQFRPGGRYQIRVRAGTKALNGKLLRNNYDFAFQTPPLELQYLWPQSGARIGYEQKFTANFNYPVSLATVREMLTMRAGGRPVAFTALYNSEQPQAAGEVPESELQDHHRAVVIIPRQRLPRDTEVLLDFRKALSSERGGQGLVEASHLQYHTYGPLQAELVQSERYFQDAWDIRLQFNNPVDLERAAAGVRFQPPVNRLNRFDGEDTALTLKNWNVLPETEYTITLPADLRDSSGNRLQGQRQFTIRFPRIRRAFDAEEGAFTVESAKQQRTPVDVSGIPEMQSSLASVGLDALLRYFGGAERSLSALNPGGARESRWATGVAANRFGRAGLDLRPMLDAQHRGWVLADIFADVESSDGERSRRSVRQLIQSTDLGLTVKTSFSGSHVWVDSLSSGAMRAGVRVAAYDGQRRLAECTTAADGHCALRHSDLPAHPVFVAQLGAGESGDRAFVSGRHQAVYMSGLAPNYDLIAPRAELLGQVVFDRRLYRPGEEVFFKAMLALRRDGQLNTGANLIGKVHVLISAPDGKTIYDQDLDATAQGGVSGGFKTDGDAPLGHYTATFSLKAFPDAAELSDENGEGGLRRELGWNYAQSQGRNEVSATFQVEEFRAVSFQVELKELHDIRHSDPLKFQVQGRYLFGAPMSGARAAYTVYRSRRSLSFPEAPGYSFGDGRYLSDEYPAEEIYAASGEGALNAAGVLEVELGAGAVLRGDTAGGLPDGVSGLAPVYTLSVEARVTDRDDKTVARRASAMAYPGDFLIGLQHDQFFGEAGKPMNFRVMTAEHSGRRDQRAHSLQWMLVRNEWKTIQSQGAGDSIQRRNTLVHEIAASGNLSTLGGEGALAPVPERAGAYTLLVRESGGAVYGAIDFYVLGAGFFGWDFADDDRVQLSAERTALKPGDTARILVQSPFERARAVISLEREGVLWQRTVEIVGNGAPIEIPIKAEYAPSVYVGVMLLTPRVGVSADQQRGADDDLGRPQIKMGYLRLDVDAGHKRLPLRIELDRQRYAPRERVSITIHTAPGAEVSVAVADRAVLDLIDYHYADPLQIFYNSWPLGVTILENRRSLIRQLSYSNKGSSPGGKGLDTALNQQAGGGYDGDDADGVRRIFKNTAHWSPTLTADDQGVVRLSVELPDNLTTFRVMALAGKAGQFNSAEQEFETRQPIVLQPIAPRILRPGDEVEVGALIANDSNVSGEFQVSLDAALLSPTTGVASQRIAVPAGESREASFRVRLNAARYAALREQKLAQLRLQVNAAEGGFQAAEVSGVIRAAPVDVAAFGAAGYAAGRVSDAVRIRFPVREEPPAEAFALSGALDSDRAEEAARLPDPASLLGGLGELELRLSTSALQGLDSGFEYFRLNPYFCLEQRASGYLLAITAGNLLKEFRESSVQARSYDFDNAEQYFLKSLGSFQNQDGGFRAWSEGGRSDPYLSAWTVFALQVAREQNRPIDGAAYDRAMNYLGGYLRSPPADDRRYILECYSLIAFVMANGGRARQDLERVLLESEADLSLRARSYLILTLIRSRNLRQPAADADVARLYAYLKNRMEISTQRVAFREENNGAYSRTYYASGATLALALRVFMELESRHPLIPSMVRHIMDRRSATWWRDSHSTAQLAYALGLYHKRYERGDGAAYAARILLADRRLIAEQMQPDRLAPVTRRIPLAQLLSGSPANQNLPLRIERDGTGSLLYYSAILRYIPALARVEARDEGIELRREWIPLSEAAGSDVRRGRPLGPSAGIRRGAMILGRLLVTLPRPAYNFALSDPLPANMEAVNSSFSTESQAYSRFLQPARSGSEWWWEDASPVQELRDDRIVYTASYLSAGVHEFFYLARATVRGVAAAPAARAWLMYEPEVFGRTEGGQRTVE